jgi:hypothetical protein
MQSANGKAIEMELPKCIGDHVLLSSAPGAGCDATGFSVCPAGFWSFLAILVFLSFGMGIFTLAIMCWKYVTRS